ncbi:hypothetical protein VIB_000389 [Vibrio metschnikovii CIP 69.14]|nr:hypothetical protein VIB_000389 [Vibrio metschnikovii CIP 69.14]
MSTKIIDFKAVGFVVGDDIERLQIDVNRCSWCVLNIVKQLLYLMIG